MKHSTSAIDLIEENLQKGNWPDYVYDGYIQGMNQEPDSPQFSEHHSPKFSGREDKCPRGSDRARTIGLVIGLLIILALVLFLFREEP